MSRKRLDYRDELVRRAAEAAVDLLDNARIGVRLPTVVTLELLKRAWLEGYEASKKDKPECQR
jgi:hypothetical protein